MKFLVYTLSDPDSGEVKYAGSTKSIAARFAAHVYGASYPKTPKDKWIMELLARGSGPVLRVAGGSNLREDAYNIERKIIVALSPEFNINVPTERGITITAQPSREGFEFDDTAEVTIPCRCCGGTMLIEMPEHLEDTYIKIADEGSRIEDLRDSLTFNGTRRRLEELRSYGVVERKKDGANFLYFRTTQPAPKTQDR